MYVHFNQNQIYFKKKKKMIYAKYLGLKSAHWSFKGIARALKGKGSKGFINKNYRSSKLFQSKNRSTGAQKVYTNKHCIRSIIIFRTKILWKKKIVKRPP